MIGARCVRLDIRSVALIILCFILNNIKISNTGKATESRLDEQDRFNLSFFFSFCIVSAVNHMEMPSKFEMHKNNSHTDYVTMVSARCFECV